MGVKSSDPTDPIAQPLQEAASPGTIVITLNSLKKDDDDGGPKTPWQVAALFFGAISSGYSWIFKTWDKSEFPEETLYHPAYWAGLALLLLVAFCFAIWRRKKSRRLDIIIITGLILAACSSMAAYFIVRRDALPPSDAFTVAVFEFRDGHDTRSTEASRRFRKNLIDIELAGLKSRVAGFNLLDRPREIKGETREEQLAYVRKWASRRKGSHLAVWADISVSETGNTYKGKLNLAYISPFGQEINDDAGFSLSEMEEPFEVSMVGDGMSIDPSLIKRFSTEIQFYWGLAAYRKADYDTSIATLPQGYSRSEYFLARSYLNKAQTSRDHAVLLTQSIWHYQSAYALEADGWSGYRYLLELSIAYSRKLLLRDSVDSQADFRGCIAASQQAQQGFMSFTSLKDPRVPLALGYADLEQARCYLAVSKMPSYSGITIMTSEALAEAEKKVKSAMGYFADGSDGLMDAKEVEGNIEYDKGNFSRAVEILGVVLDFRQHKSHEDVTSLKLHLATSKAYDALKTDDLEKYADALKMVDEIEPICQDPVTCFEAHQHAGLVRLSWADSHDNNEPKEFLTVANKLMSAESLLNSVDEPLAFAELEFQIARAYVGAARNEPEGDQSRTLTSAIDHLTAAIDIAERGHLRAAPLFRQRAQCRTRLAKLSTAHLAAAYKQAAEEDERAARFQR